jgi:hypothetical protein
MRMSNAAAETFPPMPEIGHPESYYARLVRRAERHNDVHAREAAKVGQYLTLALDPALSWQQKLRYFRHALARHCVPPPLAGELCWTFYHELSGLVREQAGREALRLASAEDDLYAARLSMGQDREKIASEAELFFANLLTDFSKCPEWFDHDDYDQLKLLRDQWM